MDPTTQLYMKLTLQGLGLAFVGFLVSIGIGFAVTAVVHQIKKYDNFKAAMRRVLIRRVIPIYFLIIAILMLVVALIPYYSPASFLG